MWTTNYKTNKATHTRYVHTLYSLRSCRPVTTTGTATTCTALSSSTWSFRSALRTTRVAHPRAFRCNGEANTREMELMIFSVRESPKVVAYTHPFFLAIFIVACNHLAKADAIAETVCPPIVAIAIAVTSSGIGVDFGCDRSTSTTDEVACDGHAGAFQLTSCPFADTVTRATGIIWSGVGCGQ